MKKKQLCGLLLAIAGLVFCCGHGRIWADVRLPHLFGNAMVLQRDIQLPVWGWADPGEKVSVQLADSPAVSTTASADGTWKVQLPPRPAGGPVTLKVTGNNQIVLDNVLIGEVWLCSGQSNMQWTVGASLNPEAEVAAANYPQIRHIAVPRIPKPQPVDDVDAAWEVCTPETVSDFSACAYFFGRYLHQKLNVPVGLIHSSWGGTRIEPWTPPVGFTVDKELADIHRQVLLTDPRSDLYRERLGQYIQDAEAWLKTARESLREQTIIPTPMPAYPNELLPLTNLPQPQQQPTTLYNGMIHPLLPFAIRGAIWYQGESNHTEGMLYTKKMDALITGWRQVWGQGPFPFYFVQIAPFQYGDEAPHILAEFWEAQAAALKIPNTGMAVISDVGNLTDIHPKNKQEAGRRLALLALANTYGQTELVCSGPMVRSMTVEGNTIRIRFDSVGGGLASRDGKPLTHFELMGKGTDFVPANAVIDGDTVVVSASEVEEPTAVRFAWHKLAEPNLMNQEGLPAVPFRAGEVPQNK